ncbi:hypothetical protein WN944_026924 [Citrus x changshan-huyou]|uniref:SWIM-type domain-containing protein n=1 Tax=Citrus x changshan-huyou TaxID=2935761 RepID=A0AAP0Q810_9ROSI
MTKSWNAWLGEMRKAPVIALVEHIRKRMIKAITERRQSCLKWPTDVPAFINKKLNIMLKFGRNYHVIPTSDALYEVETGQESYIVNLDEHTCSCGLWQIRGLPCKYEMPCIAHIRATYKKYVALCFLKDAYLRCYAGIIHPLADKSKWPHVEADEILPPIVQRPPGRPKTVEEWRLMNHQHIEEGSKYVVHTIGVLVTI